MKAILLGTTIVCLAVASFVRPSPAQDIDSRCKDIYDKVACTCAVRNGGRIIPPPVGVKRHGLKLTPKEAAEGTKTLDGGRVAFPKYYERKGFKIHRSKALEGYLTCMHRNGRK